MFKILILIFCLSLSGCKSIRSHGKHLDESDIEKLQNTKLTKSDVENLIGTPTIIPDYTANVWYYIERFSEKRAWFSDNLIDQKIVKILFDKNNIIQEVSTYGFDVANNINIVSEYTKSCGTELSVLQKFAKNIGRFNHSKEKKKNSKKPIIK